jgi:hypothetical protein
MIVWIQLTLEKDREHRNTDFRKPVVKESITPGGKPDFEKIKTLHQEKTK